MNKRFIFKLAAFLFPIILCITGSMALAIYSGEAMPVQMVIDIQRSNPYVIYSPDDEATIFSYKLASMLDRQPKVLVLGSSRVLRYRSGLLSKDPEQFYNAGGLSWNLREIEILVDHLNEQNKPDIIVIGVDQFWFNADLPERARLPNIETNTALDLERLALTTRKIWRQVLTGEVAFGQLFNSAAFSPENRGLGFLAINRGAGYSQDGSRVRSELEDERLERKRRNSFKSFTSGEAIYASGSDVSPEALHQLEGILQKAKALNIEVVGFAPPYLPEIYQQMLVDERYGYFLPALEQTEALFSRYGFSFFNFSDLTVVGGLREEMVDGVHAADSLCLKVWNTIVAARPDLFGNYVE